MEQATAERPRAEAMFTRVKDAIDELRPFLQKDGGDCELVGVEGNLVTVRMKGACMFCQFSQATVSSLQERLTLSVGVLLRIAVVPAGT